MNETTYNELYDQQIIWLINQSKLGYFTTIKRNKKYEYLKNYIYECTKFLDEYGATFNFATRIFYTLKHQQSIYRCCVDNKPFLYNLSFVFHHDIDLTHLHCCHNCAMNDDLIKQRVKDGIFSKYGEYSYWKTQECKDKIMKTCQDRYGVDFYAQSNEYKKKMENYTPSQETLKKKSLAGKRYWNSLTEEQKQHKIQKSLDTMRYKYNGKLFVQTDQYKQLLKNEELMHAKKEKEYRTKKKNNSFNTSKSEEITYEALVVKYGKDDVVRQYKSERYPFMCDFYIKSIDTFIECNYNWTHGKHFFDQTNKDDVAILEKWKAKNTPYYNNAITTWTVRDPKKLNCAVKNNLNYIVYWTLDEALTSIQKK